MVILGRSVQWKCKGSEGLMEVRWVFNNEARAQSSLSEFQSFRQEVEVRSGMIRDRVVSVQIVGQHV